MAMEAFSLPDGTRLGRVCLQVADIRRSLAFYRDVLDLRVLPPDGPAGRGSDPVNSVVLGAGGEPLVVLAERSCGAWLKANGRWKGSPTTP